MNYGKDLCVLSHYLLESLCNKCEFYSVCYNNIVSIPRGTSYRKMANKSTTFDSPTNLFIQEGVQTDNPVMKLDLIDNYLNMTSFSFLPNTAPKHQEERQDPMQEQTGPVHQSDAPCAPPKARHAKSSFHNFQKHLITIIRKFVSFSRSKLLQEDGGALTHALWSVFLEDSAANKRALHLAFGVVQINASRLQLQSLSRKNEAFRKVYAGHSHERVCAAQQLLRERTVVQARTLSKQFLKAHCAVGRFEEFHLYFRSFVDQLEAGPLARRMTKEAKASIMFKKPPNDG